MQALNEHINRIHGWCEPERNPMTRMFLSRLGGVVAVPLESAAIVIVALKAIQQMLRNTAEAAKATYRLILRKDKPEESHTQHETVLGHLWNICKLVVGVASTIFFGIVFSPEINFRFHLKLGLAVNNIAARKQRELAFKLEMEQKRADVEKQRAMRAAQQQAERQATKEAKEEANAVDKHLAELLVPKLTGL